MINNLCLSNAGGMFSSLFVEQGREVGNFIVRSSTQPLTMAVSVKLPGNLVEHYLLRAVENRIALENSTHTFETVHQLIAHYCTIRFESGVIKICQSPCILPYGLFVS
jgi:hypothetical protein